jgi:hypothetical protein
MDWAESDSGQVTMNLQFAQMHSGDIRITREDGSEVFSFDPTKDEVIGMDARNYLGVILSCPAFRVGEGYHVFVGGVQMAYTGTDVMQHPGGMPPAEGGQRPGDGPKLPEGQAPGDMPEPPEGDFTIPPQPPEGNPAFPQGGQQPPEGGIPQGGPGGFRGETGEKQTLFYMQDMVNFFSGLVPAE